MMSSYECCERVIWLIVATRSAEMVVRTIIEVAKNGVPDPRMFNTETVDRSVANDARQSARIFRDQPGRVG